ncbi:hypothetical protein FRC07_002390 [Ceratobasidium sp. 392]|nr:hypothetical protein FRC07_002390 [Ceratobasidium sp. 392]
MELAPQDLPEPNHLPFLSSPLESNFNPHLSPYFGYPTEPYEPSLTLATLNPFSAHLTPSISTMFHPNPPFDLTQTLGGTSLVLPQTPLDLESQSGFGPINPNLHHNAWAEDVGAVCNDSAYQPHIDTANANAAAEPTTSSVNDQHRLEEPYTRIMSEGRIIYQHPTAGEIKGKGETHWEREWKRNEEERGGNPWAMWGTQDEWESVRWMATTKVSQSSLDKLLRTKRYQNTGYSFTTAKQLFKKIEDDMKEFGGPEWFAEDIVLPHTRKEDKVTLFFRNLQECGDFLFSRPWFAGKMAFAPEKHFEMDDTTRLYENPWTADYWNDRQKTLPIGTTLGGLIIASDATQLSTHSGDVAAHAVYISLANIDKSVRANTSENAWMLVAYIPKSKYSRTMAELEHRPKDVRSKLLGVLNRRLFHRCMEVITRPLRRPDPHDVIDPEGNIRSVLYELIGYVADLEEQWMLAGLGGQTCPHCECNPTHLGDATCAAPRTRANILARIQKIKKDHRKAWKRSPSLEEFVNLASGQHLNGVDKPFWRSLPELNIFEVLCPDLLHGFHKFFHDHIYRFNLTGMGKPEYDARVRSQVHFSNDRAFLHGVSHIQQMTGIEHRMLERSHLCIVANAPGRINSKVTRATRAAMECIYLAQLPTQSDRTLEAYRVAYNELMEYRWGWVENETRRGKHGVIPHFNIPKMHVIRHNDEHVRRKGSADNWTTETMEHLHIDVKDAYRASNHREWKEQTTRWFNRRERILGFEAWRLWCQARKVGIVNSCSGVGSVDQLNRTSLAEEVESDGETEVEIEANSDACPQSPGGEECSMDEMQRSEGEEEDQDAYGEELRDVGEDSDERDGIRTGGMGHYVGGSAVNNMVQSWLRQQRQEYCSHVEVESGSRKRKRPSSSEDTNPRCRPRPRLQATHGISNLQKINVKPSVRRESIEKLCIRYNLDLSQLLHEIKRSSDLASLPITVSQHTYVDAWYSLRVHLSSNACNPKARMQRIRSRPAIGNQAAQNDPILYVASGRITASTAKLYDCSIGQVRLLFRLTPSILVPNPPLMAYVHAFSKIPRSACKATGLLTVRKADTHWHHRIVLASEIVRLCPLAPIIHGRAPRDVDRNNVLEHFAEFYLNKYRNMEDYRFIYANAL